MIKLKHGTYFFRNAPFAVLSSSLPGIVTYVVILYLTLTDGLEAAGVFRLYLSVFAMLGLVSFQETSKVFIRATTVGDKGLMGLLVAHRVLASLAALGLGALVYFGGRVLGRGIFGGEFLLIACCAALYYPAESYIAAMQARKQFTLLFASNLAKYAVGFGGLVIAYESGGSLLDVFLTYTAILSLFNALFFFYVARNVLTPTAFKAALIQFRRNKSLREARMLSAANFASASLAHVDKFILAAFFSVEIVGIYTLGFSTGRMIYNALKPSIYIYYGHFVATLPSAKAILFVLASLTGFGAVLAGTFAFATYLFEALAVFKSSVSVATVIFLSYGIAMANVICSQSVVINKDMNSIYTPIANFVGSLLGITVILSSAIADQYTAMILCALQFPVRHGVGLAMLWYWVFRNKQVPRKATPAMERGPE